MPGPSGWDLLHELREAGNEIPVLFVTGRKETADKLRGIDFSPLAVIIGLFFVRAVVIPALVRALAG